MPCCHVCVSGTSRTPHAVKSSYAGRQQSLPHARPPPPVHSLPVLFTHHHARFAKKDAAHGLPTETEGVVDTVAKIVLGLGGAPGQDGVVDKLAADGTHNGNGAVANGHGAH